MLEVEYNWNGWFKKDGVNTYQVLCNQPGFKYLR